MLSARNKLGEFIDSLRFLSPPFHLSYWKWLRLLILNLVDVIIIGLSYWLAFFLRLDSFELAGYLDVFFLTLPLVIISNLCAFYILGMYRQVWRFANFQSAVMIGRCVLLGTLLFVMASYLIARDKMPPRSVPVAFWFITVILVIVTKFFWRGWSSFRGKLTSGSKAPCIIYGAGSAGELFARHVLANPNFPYFAVGFVDDDRNKKGRLLHGIKILGTGEDLPKIVKSHYIDTVVLCMHAVPGKIVRNVVDICHKTGVKSAIMPDMANALGWDVFQPRAIDVKDLLRRAPKPIDRDLLRSFFKDQCVLVTGAGGSIGSEICRQIVQAKPKKLIMLDASEFNLYKIDMEFQEIVAEGIEIQSVLGNIVDPNFVDRVFKTYSPTCVLHAAAYKHVPLVESNPVEAVINNVMGTKLVAETAIKYQTPHFLLISTDKAVLPTNVMGATKRCCELLIQSYHSLHGNKCKFVAVRFGNVLGSSGSVIPRFLEQIQSGGPLTVTHPDVTRYFMLTSEAVGLVLQSIVLSKGGEIFVLNMGEPVKIYEMAKQLIVLAGKEPDRDIDIEFTGLRPGEKLYEELIIEGAEQHVIHDDVFVARPQIIDPSVALKRIHEVLDCALKGNVEATLALLKDIIASDALQSSKSVDVASNRSYRPEVKLSAEASLSFPSTVPAGVTDMQHNPG